MTPERSFLQVEAFLSSVYGYIAIKALVLVPVPFKWSTSACHVNSMLYQVAISLSVLPTNHGSAAFDGHHGAVNNQ